MKPLAVIALILSPWVAMAVFIAGIAMWRLELIFGGIVLMWVALFGIYAFLASQTEDDVPRDED